MRAYGVTYDTGFSSAGTTTHEPFDPEVVRRELRIIRDELCCDAVRITGGKLDRLEIAARHAASAGLQVWYCPFTNALSQDELRDFLLDSAERAERIRQDGAQVVFVTGSEISLFTDGFLPGHTPQERVGAARIGSALSDVPTRINGFLAEVVTGVRARFGGRISYASLPLERVDWTPFDIIASDAAYRNASNAASLPDNLRALTSQGKPFAVTEFGCPPYRGAADSGTGDSIVEWDAHARPIRLTAAVVRDEAEQATYIRELLDIFDNGGVDTAFVNTFARRDLPTSTDAERDFDVASFGVVKVLEPGRVGTAGLPWEPKAAFHTLAEYGRARQANKATA